MAAATRRVGSKNKVTLQLQRVGAIWLLAAAWLGLSGSGVVGRPASFSPAPSFDEPLVASDTQSELEVAIRGQDCRAVLSALRKGAKAMLSNSESQPPLLVAADAGCRDCALLLIGAGANIDQKGANGRTALMASISHADVTKALLDCGASVSEEDDNGWRALHHAAATGTPDVCNLLLGAIDDGTLRAKDNQGRTALDFAAGRGRLEVMKSLIARGARPSDGDINSLSWASQSDCGECLEILIEKGASIFGSSESLPIVESAMARTTVTMKKLLDAGANPNDLPNGGTPALNVATLKRSIPHMLLLLERHVDPNLKGPDGATALIVASKSGEPLVPVGLLLAFGAEIGTQDVNGKTALVHAVIGCSYSGDEGIKTADALIRAGADPLLRDKQGKTALDYCDETRLDPTTKGHLRMVLKRDR